MLDEAIVEFCGTYHFWPAPEMPWHEYWLLYCRAARFDARRFLQGGNAADDAATARLLDLAYPFHRPQRILFQRPAAGLPELNNG